MRRTLSGLEVVAREKEPVFAFAHILKPHNPYVFDRDCSTLARAREVHDSLPYMAQLECVNRMLLETVTEILRSSDTPPVIILQGDHGSKLLHAAGYDDVDQVPPDAARERVGAFGAYYLPDGGAAAFGDTVTVVNVMGNILRYYFGADLPRAGDEQYLSTEQSPFRFRRVDSRWLAGEHSGGSGTSAGN